MGRTPMTNERFARFVDANGHVTFGILGPLSVLLGF
jgi:hypothetical protein